MKRRILTGLAAALLALAARPGMAQEGPPPTERVPTEKPVEKPPETPVTPQAPPVAPGCGVRVLWLDHWVPVERLVPREVITDDRRPSLEVAYRPEKRVVCETILKSREVERLVPCTVMKPVTQTCPETGQCTTVLQPCTEVRTVKEWEYYAVPVERTEWVQVPFVRPAEIVVPRRTIVLEYRSIMQKCPEAVVIPGPEGQPDRYEMPPRECHHDEHP